MNTEPPDDGINRRYFLLLAAAAASGCESVQEGATHGERTVDAGPASQYAADGVYGSFANQGFFVIRKGAQLTALSSVCTHRACKVTAEPDRSFWCHCHGSTFDPAGRVTEGPAKRDLPLLASATNAAGHLVVKVPIS